MVIPIPVRPTPEKPTRPEAPAKILPFRSNPRPERPAPRRTAARCRSMAGQATTEYALVLLAAAAIALLLVAWATRTGAIGDLFDAVMSNIKAKV